MLSVLRRWWIPIIMVLVIVSSTALVARIRTYFGAVPVIVTPVIFGEDPDPHNPKRVTYEVSGSGTYADINYLDPDAIPRDLNNITLPWTMTVIRCRIVIDGKVKDERTSTGVNAQTFCLVKAG
ncbi:putative membrane protein mmpS4 [Mycobacterium marinum]|uniref:MmpS family transport accessory protein n=1 Tax=Mycobacterium marinum TaxID=1781 RepID=UPI000E3D3622|nr:MmpS family transport accessory protein [Mycobacterium marinum]RFZ04680.1 putative membrane protein mmpS4 [Mycobacterium marinum]